MPFPLLLRYKSDCSFGGCCCNGWDGSTCLVRTTGDEFSALLSSTTFGSSTVFSATSFDSAETEARFLCYMQEKKQSEVSEFELLALHYFRVSNSARSLAHYVFDEIRVSV
ncbi:uncharacterized protein G2W53_001249 [Senna tora]|uniref:Uncharacterized protein n=1 Tax=Senna tora TaxID=362788 RepID=A0A834XFK5_9FABA|nr:uncharacterized protein G2W53_001249 [Senna tora]